VKKLKITLIGLITFLSLSQVSVAQNGPFNLPNVGNYGGAVQDPGAEGATADQRLAGLIVGLVMNVRFLLTSISIGMLVVAGFRLIFAQGNEEVFSEQKKVILYSMLGLALVGFSGDISRIFSVGNCAEVAELPGNSNISCIQGGFLRDPNAIISRSSLFNQRTQIIISFIKYIIGALAVAMIIRSAFRLVANNKEDEIEKDKKNLIWIPIGLVMIILADQFINGVLFKLDKTRYPAGSAITPRIDVNQGISEIVGITNFIVSLTGPIAILGVVIGGLLYVASAGQSDQQDRAKRIIFYSLLGIIIIYGAFAVVSTLISGQALDINEVTQAFLNQIT